jgi:hypothetical protein
MAMPFWLILVVLTMGACSVKVRTYNFVDITNLTVEEVTKVEIRDGSTGELRTVIQRENIEALFDLVNNLEYTLQTGKRPETGYTYYADFYSGDNKLLRITFAGEMMQFDNTVYLIDRQILDFLKEIYNSAS